MTSWDESFADRYGVWSAHMTADVAFYVELARETDGPLVELAVGSGRVAIPVARATGRRVIGIDISPAMLELARAGAADAGVDLDLRDGDMRDLTLDEPAALIYCPFRSLLHLPTWADRRRTFERVAASLRPDGRFAWNAFAFDHRLAAGIDGEHQCDRVPHTVRYSVGDNRVDMVLDEGATSSLWWATKNEWLGLIDVAGLELEALYGGFAREPFTADSREYVFVAHPRRVTASPLAQGSPEARPAAGDRASCRRRHRDRLSGLPRDEHPRDPARRSATSSSGAIAPSRLARVGPSDRPGETAAQGGRRPA